MRVVDAPRMLMLEDARDCESAGGCVTARDSMGGAASDVPCSWPVAACSMLSVRIILARLPDVPALSLPIAEASGLISDEKEPCFCRPTSELGLLMIELRDEDWRLSTGGGAGGGGDAPGSLRGLISSELFVLARGRGMLLG